MPGLVGLLLRLRSYPGLSARTALQTAIDKGYTGITTMLLEHVLEVAEDQKEGLKSLTQLKPGRRYGSRATHCKFQLKLALAARGIFADYRPQTRSYYVGSGCDLVVDSEDSDIPSEGDTISDEEEGWGDDGLFDDDDDDLYPGPDEYSGGPDDEEEEEQVQEEEEVAQHEQGMGGDLNVQLEEVEEEEEQQQ
jgi:hypothetical protein